MIDSQGVNKFLKVIQVIPIDTLNIKRQEQLKLEHQKMQEEAAKA